MNWSICRSRRRARGAAGLRAAVARRCPARAELRLDITSGTSQPLPIAIPPFPRRRRCRLRSGATSRRWSRPISNARACSVRSIRAASSRTVAAGETPRFADWRQINAQALVTGSVQPQGDGRLRVEFRLWDVFAEQQLAGFALHDDAAELAAHRAYHRRRDLQADHRRGRLFRHADRLYRRIRAGADTRVKRLAIMDQDGANHQYLTDGRALVLTPRFSPSAQQITYLSYAGGTPRVYLFNIDTGQQEADRRFPGHDLRAALLAGRQPAGPQPHRERATATSMRSICAAGGWRG